MLYPDPSANTTHLFKLGGAASMSIRANPFTMFAATGRAKCPRMAPAIMSGNDSGPRMGISGPRTCRGNSNLSATRMKFSFASIAVLDFIAQLVYIKVNPRCPQAAPRRGGHASASARTWDLLVSVREVHKMDANTVIQAISNVGFPIAAFLLMWYQCNTVVKENTAAITEMRLALDDIKKES